MLSLSNQELGLCICISGYKYSWKAINQIMKKKVKTSLFIITLITEYIIKKYTAIFTRTHTHTYTHARACTKIRIIDDQKDESE